MKLAFLGQTYNTADLPKGRDFDPVPAGTYVAKITQADLKATSTGGQMIKLRYDIIGPQHQGRVVFGNINIRNANPEAERIGMEQLGDLCRAIGISGVSDTDQLIGHDLQIKVTVKAAQGDYPAGNEVRGFKAIEGAGQTFAQQVAASPPPSATGSAPWAKRG